jgi:hypothetical protein
MNILRRFVRRALASWFESTRSHFNTFNDVVRKLVNGLEDGSIALRR